MSADGDLRLRDCISEIAVSGHHEVANQAALVGIERGRAFHIGPDGVPSGVVDHLRIAAEVLLTELLEYDVANILRQFRRSGRIAGQQTLVDLPTPFVVDRLHGSLRSATKTSVPIRCDKTFPTPRPKKGRDRSAARRCRVTEPTFRKPTSAARRSTTAAASALAGERMRGPTATTISPRARSTRAASARTFF